MGMNKMVKFQHNSHTAWEIRKRSKEKSGIVLIKLTGDRKNLRSILHNSCFRYSRPNKKQWFMTIRSPLFYLHKDNCNFHIGFPNRYVWVII